VRDGAAAAKAFAERYGGPETLLAGLPPAEGGAGAAAAAGARASVAGASRGTRRVSASVAAARRASQQVVQAQQQAQERALERVGPGGRRLSQSQVDREKGIVAKNEAEQREVVAARADPNGGGMSTDTAYQ
jgi:hypothetical protein